MAKDAKKRRFLPKPYYAGGNRAMSRFIDEHLQYPPPAQEAGVEGVVRIKIAINYKGAVIGHEILSSLGHGCDEEAIRLVHLLRFEVDGVVRKGKILFHKTLNIRFRMPKKKPGKPSASGYHYQLTSTKSATKSAAEKKKKGYSYTVEW